MGGVFVFTKRFSTQWVHVYACSPNNNRSAIKRTSDVRSVFLNQGERVQLGCNRNDRREYAKGK